MNIRKILLLGIAVLIGSAAYAQDYPRFEVPLDYSYMRFVPENYVSSFSLNGGGGGIAFYFSHWIGIEAEFQGYASTTQVYHIPVGTGICPGGCTVSASGDLFTYNVGPIFKYRSHHFEPFVEALFGGAHSNVYGSILRACQLSCVTTTAPDNNAWDFVIGGGVDIPIGHLIEIRPVQVDYVLTRFDSAFTTSNQNQNNFRYQAGVVLRF